MDKALSGSSRRSTGHSVISPRDVRAQELADVLLWRLRGIIIIFLAGLAIGGVTSLFWPQFFAVRWRGFLVWFAAVTPLASWLFWRRSASLRALRLVEITFFGLATVMMSRITVIRFTGQPLMAGMSPALVQILESSALYWCGLIVLYGTWIPNTGRRCAVVIAGLVGLALGVMVFLGLWDPELGQLLFSPVFVVPLFWVGAAAAIAVYGSNRINLLTESLATARTLGPYQVVQRLGSGGMGEVYLARHALLKRPCAIKIIRPERAGDVTALQRFEREVQVMARLTHWNIVEIFDVGHAADGTFYFAMEYLPGLTWQELVDKHGPLPAARVIYLLRQVCAALRDVHAAGLVHRDVKPVNVLVCSRGCTCDVVKLLDFGIAHQGPAATGDDSDRITTEGRFVGTPLYVSPEQIRARETLDGRSDLYSLGAVAYFLLTGEPPFIRDSVQDVFAAHLKDAPVQPSKLNPAIPNDLEAIVLRCLEKQPDRRFADAAEMSQQLAQCASAPFWTEGHAAAWWQQHCPELLARGTSELSGAMGQAEINPN